MNEEKNIKTEETPKPSSASRAPAPKAAEQMGLIKDRPRSSRGTPVAEFNKKHPVTPKPLGEPDKAPHQGKYRRIDDRASMHTRREHPEQYRPESDTCRNPSGPRMKMSWERAGEELAKNWRKEPDAILTRADLESLFWELFPEELRGLCHNRYGQGDIPALGSVAMTADITGLTKWGPGVSPIGTKALYKGLFLRGYTRASLDDPFPDTPDAPSVEAVTTYTTDGSGLHTLLWTIDWPRVGRGI